MSVEKVFVYLPDEQKSVVKHVAKTLDISESLMFRALAYPTVEQLAKALKKGVDPGRLKRKVLERIEDGAGG